MKTIGKMFFFILIISACSKDNNNPPPEPENRPPGNFTVTTSVEGNNATIMWTQATDPDGDAVNYSVVLDGNTILNGAANRNSVEAENLNFDTSYSGTVTASDPDGLTSTSDFSFTTGMEPNEAPEKAILSSPANEASGVVLLPELTWQAAADPDGDPVTYEVFLDTNDADTSITTDITELAYILVNELELNTTYYWKVRVKDDKGAMTDSDIQSFTTNQAPGVFNLLSPVNDARDIPLNVELSWDAAVDPDGDSVLYDVYLDQSANPSTKVMNQTQVTNFSISDLENETRYYWKVIATDLKGGEAESEVRSFVTQGAVVATEVTTSAAFSRRYGHGSVVFNNKMWVVGGINCCGTFYEDVWSSSDGENWDLVTDTAPFGRRGEHALVVHDGKMWLIGGRDSFAQPAGYKNDVWVTEDGINWTPVALSAAFSPRYNLQVVSFNNSLVLIGGVGEETSDRNEVWSSTDGGEWTQLTADAGFCCRGFRATVFKDSIWYIAGFSNSVFKSSNGINWEVVTDNAPLAARVLPTVVVYDDRLWMTGGRDGNNSSRFLNDIWYSGDGENWTQANENLGFAKRFGHSSVVFNDKIWVIAGDRGTAGDSTLGDVWSIE
ncbi:hypothetical protein ABN763_09965 [Spongiivirga sp. MCCC 1A20706]|uniref:Kelch repeat-containing protein n=1 Tax=Spongiivirga sp. MCCC 1A20706 TaxID=3160963 RepID=UPI0039773A7B